jgi:hypothetical protein
MTSRRIRDLYRLLVDEAAPYGAAVRIKQTNGGHLRSIFSVGAREMFIITPLSPGNTRRFDRNVRTVARRVLSNLRARAKG